MYHRIKEIRQQLHINQTDFAKRLGLSQSTLAMMEVGKRRLGEKHIKLICSVFQVNEEWLRTGQGEIFRSSPYEKEFLDIFEQLEPENQQFLLSVARQLLQTQQAMEQRCATLSPFQQT